MELPDLLVAVRSLSMASDVDPSRREQAQVVAANLSRQIRRQRSLSSAIKDLPERCERPTIPAEKRAHYRTVLDECRAELPLIEAGIAHWRDEADQLLKER